jgi:hypothetical protein
MREAIRPKVMAVMGPEVMSVLGPKVMPVLGPKMVPLHEQIGMMAEGLTETQLPGLAAHEHNR